MDKAAIEKILEELREDNSMYDKSVDVRRATSSLTSLIIKWLEERKVNIEDHHQKYYPECHRCIEILARNQLITELVEELK